MKLKETKIMNAYASRQPRYGDGLVIVLALCAVLLALVGLFGCQGPGGGLGLVAKTSFQGSGVVAANDEWAIAVVNGYADAGMYQLSQVGELRLTAPTMVAESSVRLVRWDGTVNETYPLGDPLPAWAEPVVRSMLTPDQVTQLGLLFGPNE